RPASPAGEASGRCKEPLAGRRTILLLSALTPARKVARRVSALPSLPSDRLPAGRGIGGGDVRPLRWRGALAVSPTGPRSGPAGAGACRAVERAPPPALDAGAARSVLIDPRS